MISPDVISALIAAGRAFEVTPDGGLIVQAVHGPDARSRKARNQAAYRARKAATNGNATATSGNDVAKVTETVTKPSPSPLSPTPPIPTPPPTLSPAGAREEPGFALQAEQPPPAKRFTAPSEAEWKAFGSTLDPPLPDLEAANAWNHYQAKGWKVGSQPMKDWKAALRTCHGRWLQDGKHITPQHPNARSHPQNRSGAATRSDSANRPGRYG